jgi:hypothetical protein
VLALPLVGNSFRTNLFLVSFCTSYSVQCADACTYTKSSIIVYSCVKHVKKATIHDMKHSKKLKHATSTVKDVLDNGKVIETNLFGTSTTLAGVVRCVVVIRIIFAGIRLN